MFVETLGTYACQGRLVFSKQQFTLFKKLEMVQSSGKYGINLLDFSEVREGQLTREFW